MWFSDGAYRGDVCSALSEGERLAYEVLSVVEEIPPGKVASYGQIARLVGKIGRASCRERVYVSV